MIERLGDGEKGGFFVAGDEPDVLFRSKEVFDGALPSANAVAVLGLVELAELSGEERFRATAAAALRAFGELVEQQPEGARMLCLAARHFHLRAGGQPREGRGAHTAVASAVPATGGLDAEARSVVMTKLSLGEPGEAAEPGFQSFRLTVEVREGWHLYAHEPGHGAAIATGLDADGAELRAVSFPEGKVTRLAEGGEVVAIYEDRFEVRGELRTEAGETARLRLSFQPCELTRCLPPATVTVPIA
jgi:hypothetical protein